MVSLMDEMDQYLKYNYLDISNRFVVRQNLPGPLFGSYAQFQRNLLHFLVFGGIFTPLLSL